MVTQYSKALCDFQKKNILFQMAFTTKHAKNIIKPHTHAAQGETTALVLARDFLCFHCSIYDQSCFAAQTRDSGNTKYIESASAGASAASFLTPIAFFLCSIPVS